MFLIFLLFSSLQCPRQVLQTEVGRTTFYMHQTSGVCTGVCACYRTHEMEKTDTVHYLSN